MSTGIFNISETADGQVVEQSVESDALIEIARSPAIKQYFKKVIKGYDKHIVEASKPLKIEENKILLLQLHAKKESLEKMLSAAEDEARNT